MNRYRWAHAVLMLVALFLSSVLQAEAKRVVSIDGSITEIIYALKAEELLVGVDTTSRYPAATQELPNIGYMRQLSGEGILSLNPNLVIASADAGPEKVLHKLKDAGLDIHVIKSERSIDGVVSKIQQIASILGLEERSLALINQLKNTILHLQEQMSSQVTPRPPKVMFLLAAGGHGVMVAGQDTQADAMIRIMGGDNVVTEFSSYKPLTPEGALQLMPEVIVIADTPSRPFSLEDHPTLKMTPAFMQGRVVHGDSMLLLSFGPRLGEAMVKLMKPFYPSLSQLQELSEKSATLSHLAPQAAN